MTTQYSLKRSRKRKKTISLQIGNNSEITIYAPYFTPVTEINRFVEEKQNWIDRAIRKQALLPVQHKEKTYATGEIFYYLGQAIRWKPILNRWKTRALSSGITAFF